MSIQHHPQLNPVDLVILISTQLPVHQTHTFSVPGSNKKVLRGTTPQKRLGPVNYLTTWRKKLIEKEQLLGRR